jgi:ketosteroid isomerase-like protein
MLGPQRVMKADGPPASPPSPASGLVQEAHDARLSGDRDVSALAQEQVVELLFDAFSRRSLTDALWLLDPEIVFEPMTAMVTRDGDPYRGHEGIERYMQDVQAHWQELTLRPGRIRVAGDAAVVLGTVSGRGIAGSFENVATSWILKFRNGRVVRAQIFSNPGPLANALTGESA